MMRIFARIQYDKVMEFFEVDDDDKDIYDYFPHDLVWVDVTSASPMPSQNWNAYHSDDSDWQFTPPEEPVLTPEQKLADNTARRDILMTEAGLRIAPLQDAVDLDDATPEEVALLKKWKQYRVALNRLNLSVDPIAWPDKPEQPA